MTRSACSILFFATMIAITIPTTTTTTTTSALRDLATQRASEIAALQAAIFSGSGSGTAAPHSLNDGDLHELVQTQGQLLDTYKSAYAQDFRATKSLSICKSFSGKKSLKWSDEINASSTLPNPLRFLHIPKAGMSIKNAIIHSCCPHIPQWMIFGSGFSTSSFNFSEAIADGSCTTQLDGRIGHAPLTAHQRAHPEMVVALFRKPNQRVISAYFAHRHTIGDGSFNRSASRIVGGRLVAFENTTLPEFARFPGIAGCTTRMVLGLGCASEMLEPSDGAAREAAAIVRRFAFVGLTDHFDASICLWHKTFGNMPPLAVEFANVHVGTNHPVRRNPKNDEATTTTTTTTTPKTTTTTTTPASRFVDALAMDGQLEDYDETALGEGFYDTLDEVVYAAARAEFKQRFATVFGSSPEQQLRKQYFSEAGVQNSRDGQNPITTRQPPTAE